jgi:hypothetical protein
MAAMGAGSRITAIPGLTGFVVLGSGRGVPAYRMSVVRRGAIDSGEDDPER